MSWSRHAALQQCSLQWNALLSSQIFKINPTELCSTLSPSKTDANSSLPHHPVNSCFALEVSFCLFTTFISSVHVVSSRVRVESDLLDLDLDSVQKKKILSTPWKGGGDGVRFDIKTGSNTQGKESRASLFIFQLSLVFYILNAKAMWAWSEDHGLRKVLGLAKIHGLVSCRFVITWAMPDTSGRIYPAI